MKRIGIVAAALMCALLALGTALAQDQLAVPIDKEPHHHLVLENEYVRVFRVSVPAHGATLLHQHTVPYIYLSLGPADVTNAVQDKPEAKLVMADGQIGYSRGNFAHVARVNGDADFNNVTIELLKKQGEPRNACEKVIEGPLNCEQPTNPLRKPVQPLFGTMRSRRLMETEEVSTLTGTLGSNAHLAQGESKAQLLVADEGAELRVKITGGSEKTLKGGEVLWIPAGSKWTMESAAQDRMSSYLLLSFKD
jgi:hypothetical protein